MYIITKVIISKVKLKSIKRASPLNKQRRYVYYNFENEIRNAD